MLEECDWPDQKYSIYFVPREELEKAFEAAEVLSEEEIRISRSKPRPLTFQFKYKRSEGVSVDHMKAMNSNCVAITGRISRTIFDQITMSEYVIGFVDVTEMREID